MKKPWLLLFWVLLVFASCTKPPEKMSTYSFFILLQNGQIDKVKIVNETNTEFTIKNSKEFPMGKWYQLPANQNTEAFIQSINDVQRGFTDEKKANVTQETRIAFLRDAFNYLLPILVLAGLIAGFMALRRNRS
jgi:ATP-dependent Zn protease